MTLVPDTPNMSAQPGDDVYLGSMLTKLHLWGIVSDIDTPAMMSGSFEVLGDEAALVLDALVGPRGPAGANSPIVNMQWSPVITDINDLPKNLLNDPADIGKAWWVGNVVAVWTGQNFQLHQMGTTGPAGPVARVSPTLEIVDGPTEIDVTGTTTNPSWHMHINRNEVKGPPGPSAAIANAADYDNSQAITAGAVLTAVPGAAPNSFLWGPRARVARHTRLYTVPEGAFSNFFGITQFHTILSYQVEPQLFDWVPHVSGHIKAAGIEIDIDPLQIGVEVRLGDPMGGELVGRGHGVPFGWSIITPHFSTPGDSFNAVSPSNQVAMVPAGQPGDIHVSLKNDGLLGLYLYNNKGSQLSILVVPEEEA